MIPAETPPCTQRELVLEQALLGLAGAELQAFELHLTACADCLGTQARLLDALAESLETLEPVPPPPSVWDRIEARIASVPASADVQPWKRWTAPHPQAVLKDGQLAGLSILRPDPAAWQTTANPGIEVQSLSVSKALRQATMLVRMAAGSSYPAHRHGGPEECYVLSGDLWIGEQTELRAGDFQRAEAGSLHPVQSTRQGCLLLIQTSLDDELLR